METTLDTLVRLASIGASGVSAPSNAAECDLQELVNRMVVTEQ